MGVIVCQCNVVSDRVIRKAVSRGASTVADLMVACDAGTCCGACHPELEALLALGRLRKPGFLPLTLALTIAILIGGLAGLLVLGSSQQAKDAVARDPQVLGVGIYAIALGGLATFLGGLFAVRRGTWWKAYLLTIVAVASAILGVAAYVKPA